jgi:hypothetical protein
MADIKQLSDEDLQKALGYKSGTDITKVSDSDLQAAVTADLSPEMKQAQSGTMGWNPYIKALQKTGNEAIVNPIVQSVNGVTPVINGINKIEGNNLNIPQIQGPDMSKAPMAAKVEGDIAGGASQGLATTAMGGGNPILGYAALSGVSAFGKGEPILPAAVSGAGEGAIGMGAGWAGSKGAQMIAKPLSSAAANVSNDAAKWITKYAPNIGTALGMGGANAAMAPSGNKLEAAATGATFGAMSPVAGPKFITSDEYQNKYLPQAGDKIIKVLNPGKNVYTNFDNSGNDVNDAANTIAHNRIIIGKTADGRIDTTDGQQQLLNATKPYAQQLQQMLGTNKSTMPGKGGFDLEDLRQQALNKISNHPDFQDAVSRQAARNQVNKFIDAEIAEPGRGRYVNGQTLDDIKGGWWKVRYDQNNAVAKPVGGLLGNIAKTQLENAYPNQPIADTNAAQGKLLNAYHLLDMTNGNKIKGEGLGNHIIGVGGAVIGHAAGGMLPIPGVSEIIGSGVGFGAGELGGKYMNDPTRITKGISDSLDNLRIVNPSGYNQGSSRRPGVVNPQVLPTNPNNTIRTPQPAMMNPIMNPNRGLSSQMSNPNQAIPMPSPKPVMPQAQGGQTMGGSQNPIHNLPPEALKNLEKQIKIEKIIRS